MFTKTMSFHLSKLVHQSSLIKDSMAGVAGGSSGITFTASDADAFDTVVNVADKTDDSGRVTLTLTAGSTDTSAVLTINTGWDASTWGDLQQNQKKCSSMIFVQSQIT